MVASPKTLELLSQDEFEVKFRAGGQYTPVKITVEHGRMFFWYDYFPPLNTEIKIRMEKRKYHGFESGKAPFDVPTPVWSAPITPRNLFQFEHLLGKYGPKPYSNWEQTCITEEQVFDYTENRQWGNLYRPGTITDCFKCGQPKDSKIHSLGADGAHKFQSASFWQHQVDMIIQGYSSHHVYWAVEMRLGKSLAAIITMELLRDQWNLKYGDIMWVAPRSALAGAKVDFNKWNTPIAPDFQSYNGLVSSVEKWSPESNPPRVLILDEATRCKTPTTQRSVAGQIMADAMRECWGMDCLIIEMSGSPAPKTPADWHKPIEILCPGYLREATWYSFRETVGVVLKQESEVPGAGTFNKLAGWKDDEDKCNLCTKPKEDPIHNSELSFLNLNSEVQTHAFVPGVNEVEKIGKRLKGIAIVKHKKDCLDIPAIQYEMFHVEPSTETLRAAEIILGTSRRAVDALIKLRTLSDGFLYKEVPTGNKIPCKACEGSGKQHEYFDKNEPDHFLEMDEVAENCRFIYESCPPDQDPNDFIPAIIDKVKIDLGSKETECVVCEGSTLVDQMHRTLDEVACPKDQVLIDLLGQHEEVGRFNVYAGFQGSIDRVCKIARRHGWATFKADGLGWEWTSATGEIIPMSDAEMLVEFAENRQDWTQVVFVGQPGAAGMGIDLASSPGTFYFSNDNNPESRTQSEARGHSPNMDIVRGCWIYDVIHLPSDLKVLMALRESRRLEKMSMEYLRNLYLKAPA